MLTNSILKPKVMSGLFWKLLERGGSQGIQFIVQIFLARLLLPSDYGTLALVIVFISIANVFVQNGFGVSLIQKKEVHEVDFSSVFYVSLALSSIVYLVLYIASPAIARFYSNKTLIPVLRILALTLFPGALNSIQNAIISRNMQFQRLFYSSVGAGFISGIIGISMAYMGYGIWALVFQQLSSQICMTLILWFTIRWRPALQFSLPKVKSLFSFGWKVLVSSLIDTMYWELRSLIVGKIYAPAMLGYYNRGQQFPQLIVANINGTIQSVMFPALAAQQDYAERVKSMVRRSIVTSSFIVFPLMVGLAVISEPLVIVVLTDKWLPSVPFLQIFCAAFIFWPIHTANLQAIMAMGRSDIFLKLEVQKKIVGLAILAISLPFGIYALAFGEVLCSVVSSFINAYPNKKLLNYGYLEQIKDVLPSLAISLVMGAIVYSLLFLHLSSLATMVLQVLVGVLVYVGFAMVLKLECYRYLVDTLSTLLKERVSRKR